MTQNDAPGRVYARAVDALNQGDWRHAGMLATSLFRIAPNHAGVHFICGVAALQLGNMPLALERLSDAVRLNPERADYLAQYARALAATRNLRKAMETAAMAASRNPVDPLTLDTLGVIHTQGNAHDEACRLFSAAVDAAPDHPGYRFNLATSLTFAGHKAEAEREYEACLGLAPDHWKAHLALAQLRTWKPAKHLPRLERLLEQNAEDRTARMYLNLAMAKELEDSGDYPRAFDCLQAGKKAGGESRGYSIERDRMLFTALMEQTPDVQDVIGGERSREPIFIMGMPRSGTTLLDRMLSNHPDVHSAGELPDFGIALKRASGSTTAALLDVDTVHAAKGIRDWSAVGATYLAGTRPNTGHTPRFTDKLPHNFLYAAYIARALPSASIICMRRNAMDTCLGNFRQLFAQDSPYYDYSFDLLDCGRYWLLFDRLMECWREKLPGRILEVDYESLVADPALELDRVLRHCQLPWNDACLDFQNNKAPVATASASQVREPLTAKSIGRWRNYEPQLSELARLLQ